MLALPIAAGLLSSCMPKASALTVFDPSNYQQNLLAATRALEQINNQVRTLQNQAQMILRMDTNPASTVGLNSMMVMSRMATPAPSEPSR